MAHVNIYHKFLGDWFCRGKDGLLYSFLWKEGLEKGKPQASDY